MGKQPTKPPEIIAASDAVSDGSRDLAQHQAFVMWLQDHLGGIQPAPLSWLDLGCGKGQVFFAIEKNLDLSTRGRIAYVGVDGSTEHTAATETRALACRLKSVDVRRASLTNLSSLRGQSFDLVTIINTCHEIPPKALAGLLFDSIALLAPEGRLLAYDMEQLPKDALELGALTWSRPEIDELTKALVATMSPADGAVATGTWNHHSCTAWNMWVRRSQLKPPKPLAELRQTCLESAAKVTNQILERRLKSVRDTLEVLTTHGAATANELVDMQRSLHDLWALDRARNEL